jgi:CubicO group peptidase (beta-lactamase class C family)
MKYVVLLLVMLPILPGQTDDTARALYKARAGVTRSNWDEGGNRSRWVYLHASEVFPAAILHRAAPQRTLPVHLRPEIGNFELDPSRHNTLSAWLPSSPIDGFIVVHKGAIVYEQYPHMQQSDLHLIMSVTKAFVGTVLGLIENSGKVDFEKPVEAYLPEFAGTAWAGTSVRDVAEMASGMEGAEDSAAAYLDPKHKQFQMEASLGWRIPTPEMPAAVANGDTYGLLRTFRRVRKAGEQFAYTSANTILLADLIERITGRRLADVIAGDIWSRIGAEHDALLLVNDKGIPVAHAGLIMTLRDLARFGLLSTPSSDGVLPRTFLDRLLHGGRPALLGPKNNGDHASYQWDVITPAGEMVKGGFGDQLLYIDTNKDVVLAYFGTNLRVDSMPARLPLRKMVAQYF